jgi:hypothetical protein
MKMSLCLRPNLSFSTPHPCALLVNLCVARILTLIVGFAWSGGLVLPDNTDHAPTLWAVNPTAMGIQSLVDDETKKAFAEIQQKVGARRLVLAVWLAAKSLQ